MSITITHTTNKKEYMRIHAKKFYDKNSIKIIEYKYLNFKFIYLMLYFLLLLNIK